MEENLKSSFVSNIEDDIDSPSKNTRSKVMADGSKNTPSSSNLPSNSPIKKKQSTPNTRASRTPVSTEPNPSGSGKANKNKLSEIRAAALRKKRQEMGKNKMLAQEAIYDPDATAREAKYTVKGDTGIIMDDFMERHFSPWDENHVERPERLTYIRERLGQLGLIERCKQVKIEYYQYCSEATIVYNFGEIL